MKDNFYLGYLLTMLVEGLVWLRSSYGKISSGNFVDGMEKSLNAFASKNPFPQVKEFLLQTALPNTKTFGALTLWGEALVALSIVGAAAYLMFGGRQSKAVVWVLLLGLLGGMFLNAVFWLSAGWTSPSTDSVNAVMFGTQLVGFVVGLRLLKR